ncbi:immunoglobulin-binding regulator [Escherichia coli]|nr:immunoglobulin-binding regulator [Escherichia coli]
MHYCCSIACRKKTAEHYRNKIAIYLHWYQKKGIEVPQTQQGDIGAKDIPSWRRICKVLLNNDYWCRALSFSPTKAKNYQRYNERIKGKRQEWGYYATTINAGFNAISRQLAGR